MAQSLQVPATELPAREAPASTVYTIEAPPQLTYDSEEAAETALHEWTLGHGFNISRKKPAYNKKGEVRNRLFECDHAGKPKNTRKLTDSDRVRLLATSKRFGCPMRIRIEATNPNNPTGPWRIAYTRDGSRMHNHPPSFDVRVHVAHRQRDARETARQTDGTSTSISDLVELQALAGVSNSKIFATAVLSNKETLLIPGDIANKKKIARTKLLATLTSTEALLRMLEDNGFHYTYEVDPSSNRLRYLMWAHPTTTALARDFMDLLVLDCTYNTNKFRMPLLNVVTLTGMNTVLPIAQIWMPGEAEPDFTWALLELKSFLVKETIRIPRALMTDRDLACTNATETVFPSSAKLLCRWHIRRNILAQARVKIAVVETSGDTPLVAKSKQQLNVDVFMAKYDEAVDAPTESEFEECCVKLRSLSSAMDKYLNRTWWPYKSKFVKCWTDKHIHFGLYSTSIVEGTHATMKRWLDNSRGDLRTVFQQLLPWWIKAATNNKVQAGRETSEIPHLLRHDRYSAVIRKISFYALSKTEEKWKMAHKIVVHGIPRTTCDGVFKHIHGRPCTHDLIKIIESNGVLKLLPEHFDRHWWLPNSDSEAAHRILEPSSRSKRQRTCQGPRPHKAGYGVSSTRREPSGFELVEQGASLRATVPQPVSFQELLEQSDEDFQQAFLPPRTWGYAGLRELDE